MLTADCKQSSRDSTGIFSSILCRHITPFGPLLPAWQFLIIYILWDNMTFSTSSFVYLVTPISFSTFISWTHVHFTQCSICCCFFTSHLLDILHCLPDSSGFLGISALHLVAIVIEIFSSGWGLDFFLSKPVFTKATRSSRSQNRVKTILKCYMKGLVWYQWPLQTHPPY